MTCCSPRSHIVDSRFFSAGYATEEARHVFCDLRRLQRWLGHSTIKMTERYAHLAPEHLQEGAAALASPKSSLNGGGGVAEKSA